MSEYLNQSIDFDNIFLDPSSESYDLIHNLLKENSKGFSFCAKNKIYIGNAAQLLDQSDNTKQLNNSTKVQICVNPAKNDDIYKDIVYFGCCPPPINVINMDRTSVIHTLSERGGYDEISSNILKQNNFTINDNVKKRKTLQINSSSSNPMINNKDEELLDEICNSDLEELSNNNPDSRSKLQNNTITEDICRTIHDDSANTTAINTYTAAVSFKNTPLVIKKRGGKLKKRKRKSHLISTIDSNNNTTLSSNENINSNSLTPVVNTLSNIHTTIDNVSDMTANKSLEDIIDYKSDLFAMMQNHSTNIYQLLNKSKENPIFELEILKNDQIVNKKNPQSFSQSLYDYFTEIGFEFDISTTLESHSLSKRGRHFYDLLEEEEFLLKLSHNTSSQQHLPSVLDDWHEMFPDWYSDNHDGYYREWLRNQQEEMKHKLIEENKNTKKKRISTDPIFRTQSKSLDLKQEDLSILSNIIAPPVPVAIHHPACWGINTRIYCYSDALKRNSFTNDTQDHHLDKQQCDNKNHSIVSKDSKEQKPIFEMIHPACYSNKIITHPIHKKTVNSNQLNDIPCKYKACSCSTVVLPYQDVDDFNIFVDKINQDLELIEADNYLKLLRLQHVIKINENSTKLKAKRQKLEDLLYRAICKNEPTNADRLIYNSSKCKVKQGYNNKKQNAEVTTIVDNYNNTTNKSSIQASNEMKASLLSRYNTRYSASDDINDICKSTCSSSLLMFDNTPSAELSFRFHRNTTVMGASSISQVSHGNATHKILERNAQIEIYVNKTWKIGTVIKVIRDRGLIRHVKVRVVEVEDGMNATTTNATTTNANNTTALPTIVWIAVEDGHLAPIGTYLRPQRKQHASKSKTQSTVEQFGDIQTMDQHIQHHRSSHPLIFVESEDNNDKEGEVIPMSHDIFTSDNGHSKIDSNNILPVHTNISDHNNNNDNSMILSSTNPMKHLVTETKKKDVTNYITLTTVPLHNNITMSELDIETKESNNSVNSNEEIDFLSENCFGGIKVHEKDVYKISPQPPKEPPVSNHQSSMEGLLDNSLISLCQHTSAAANKSQQIYFDHKPSSSSNNNNNIRYINGSLYQLDPPPTKQHSHNRSTQQSHVVIDQAGNSAIYNPHYLNNTTDHINKNHNLKRIHSIHNLQNEYNSNKRINFNHLEAALNNNTNFNISKPSYEVNNNNDMIRNPILKNIDSNSELVITSEYHTRDVHLSGGSNSSTLCHLGPTISMLTATHNNTISSGTTAAVTFRLGKNTITKNK